MYTNILLPTDGTKGTKRAADHAVELAATHGATLHVLYVVDTGQMGFVATPGDIGETKQLLRKRGEEVIERVVVDAEDAGVDCVTDIASGVPDQAILEYVDEHGIDLVVMGKRGLLDPDRHFLGSTTDRVLKRTDVPVHAV
ncbi:Nucleotide-binding universal stress protein, UspA family [Halogranum amylolyticum]|uniref:Nucleotide-binding universal stress protein, UspA family n=1 Tax=Halogranum amylolyticum TaxID=660520 RepID=A0A1H8PF16_9EURY|nr:universal stress protein [Halogranum amylolyticum]SEO40406.1 Nucleotide-binding universal stress protein, UspA family [Halogranum amylolyticum]